MAAAKACLEWLKPGESTMTTATLSNPPEIAKEAIRQLALRRMPPTPDNYARLYGEVSGVLHSTPPPADNAPSATDWSDALRGFLRAWDATIPGLTQARKRVMVEQLLQRSSPHAGELHKRFRRLVKSWGEVADVQPVQTAAAAPDAVAPPIPAIAGPARDICGEDLRIVLDLAAETVSNAVSERLGYTAGQVAEGAALAASLRNASSGKSLAAEAERLRHFWATLEMHGAGQQEVVTGLTLLLQLLLSNIAELTADDRWLKGQLERLKTLVSAPMNVHSIVDAHRSMREVIAKQGSVNHSLDEARHALKAMLASFIDRLGTMSAHTGDFHGKIEGYAARIEETDDFTHLSNIVQDLLVDTREMQSDIGRTHEDLQAAQRRAGEYETKVRDLESKLEQVSGLVCEDPLTSALNRRGLDEAFQKESARCQRGGKPLTVAVLDVDNFKQLKDRLGHQAGDYALMHLVDVVREAIRPTDVLGRYGGEEFVILLPDTGMEAAEVATVRVQRALTRRFFLHNNERQLITFSAGVAQFVEGESWDMVLDRADRALYEAKRQGKNRVVMAPADAPAPATPPAGSQAHSA